MRILTRWQLKILEYMYINTTTNQATFSPTEIGHKVGRYNNKGNLRHSAWASPKLKSLCKMGLCGQTCEKKYYITDKGIEKIKE